MALRWEEVETVGDASPSTFRVPVPGGWLVAVGDEDGIGVTFYPDPDGQWDP